MLEADVWLHFGSYMFGLEVLVIAVSTDRVVFEVPGEGRMPASSDEIKTFMELVETKASELIECEVRIYQPTSAAGLSGQSLEPLTLKSPLCPLAFEPSEERGHTQSQTRPFYRSLSHRRHQQETHLFALEGLRAMSTEDEQSWDLLKRSL